MTDLKIGDRVKIILSQGYISTAAQAGKEGIVKRVTSKGLIGVMLESGAQLNFNSRSLERIGITTTSSQSAARTHRVNNDGRSICYDCKAPTRIVDTGNPSSTMRVCTKCDK